MAVNFNEDLINGDKTIFELAEYFGIRLIDRDTVDLDNPATNQLSDNPTQFAWITKDLAIAYNLPYWEERLDQMPRNKQRAQQFAEAFIHEIAHLIVGVERIDIDDDVLTGVAAVQYALTFALANGEELREEMRNVWDNMAQNNLSWARGVIAAYERGLICELGFVSNKIGPASSWGNDM